MLKEEVLSMLLNAQEPVSGEGICKTLGVTRAAVLFFHMEYIFHQHIKVL